MMLAGKVAIITGGARGIGIDGRQVRCRGGEGRGVRHHPELMQQTLAAIRSKGGEARAIRST